MRAVIVVVGVLLGAWVAAQIGAVMGPLGVVVAAGFGAYVCMLMLKRLQYSGARR